MNLLSQEEDFQKFEQVYRSRKLVVCRIQEITPVDFHSSEERVLPTRLPATGEGAAVGSHGRGSDNASGQAPHNRPDTEPRNERCQPSPLSLLGASSPSCTGSTTRYSSEQPPMIQFRPINSPKHCRSEIASGQSLLAKRRKTQQSEDSQGRDVVSELPDDGSAAQAHLDGLTQWGCVGGQYALPAAVISHHPGGGLLTGAQPAHAGGELFDESRECSENQPLPTCGRANFCVKNTNVSNGQSISPMQLLLAAVERDGRATTDARCDTDGRTDSRDGPFGPRGNPGVMLLPENAATVWQSDKLGGIFASC